MRHKTSQKTHLMRNTKARVYAKSTRKTNQALVCTQIHAIKLHPATNFKGFSLKAPPIKKDAFSGIFAPLTQQRPAKRARPAARKRAHSLHFLRIISI
jgi:hypothetical protein